MCLGSGSSLVLSGVWGLDQKVQEGLTFLLLPWSENIVSSAYSEAKYGPWVNGA